MIRFLLLKIIDLISLNFILSFKIILIYRKIMLPRFIYVLINYIKKRNVQVVKLFVLCLN